MQRHFKNNDDAKTVVQEIEQIIDAKVDAKKDILATKEDLHLIKEDILKFQVDVEKRFNSIILWIVGTGVGTTGLIFQILNYSFQNKNFIL
ncbi:MAG: hypothetical protein H0V14_05715 [Chitinophagaceae bacterium]|nr:hypothetical protein [Chitinophagaceae bacterium]